MVPARPGGGARSATKAGPTSPPTSSTMASLSSWSFGTKSENVLALSTPASRSMRAAAASAASIEAARWTSA